MTVQKMRLLRTGCMVMEDRGSCRCWTISLGQKGGTTTVKFAMRKAMGLVGSVPRFTRGFRKVEKVTHLQKKKEKWCGWQPETVEHKIEFMKNVMEDDAHRV